LNFDLGYILFMESYAMPIPLDATLYPFATHQNHDLFI